jgi:hypothetical protein
MDDSLKKLEESKRNRHWNSAARWRMLQEAAEWIDSQRPVPRNSKAGCLENQARLLMQLSRSASSLVQ